MAEIVLALDVPDADAAMALVARLPRLRWVKVGPVLFTAAGAPLVRALRRRGLAVFLDLKWHDIPNTVAGGVAAARALDVQMVTVHALGGRRMLTAAVEAAGPGLAVVAVTMLTSHSEAEFAEVLGAGHVAAEREVVRLARLAESAGARGVVCSPLELPRAHELFPPPRLLVVPGIRRPGDAAGDQARTAGPAEAVRAGATHLVVGRPIVAAADPVGALDAFLAEVGE